jgi:hypothetical protein
MRISTKIETRDDLEKAYETLRYAEALVGDLWRQAYEWRGYAKARRLERRIEELQGAIWAAENKISEREYRQMCADE